MKGDVYSAGVADEFGSVGEVNVVAGIEDAEYDSIDTEFATKGDVAFHGVEFCGGINERASARTNHDEERDAEMLARGLDGSCAWSDASDGDVGAKFDAIGSGVLRDDRVVERVGADLENGFSSQWSVPGSQFPVSSRKLQVLVDG
jgi:hypothetical protein